MRISWLYLAMRSERLSEPVLICPQLQATARSAIVESSVSPERWDITDVYAARCAISTASRVSDSEPIWLTFTRIELAPPILMPDDRRSVLVTHRSSPTSWIFLQSASVSAFQPSQSSSAIPSSMVMIGNLSTRPERNFTLSAELSDLPSPSISYLPFLKYSVEAQSRPR